MVDSEVVNILVQGGAVGLAFASIGALVYTMRALFNHLTVSVMVQRRTATHLAKIATILTEMKEKK